MPKDKDTEESKVSISAAPPEATKKATLDDLRIDLKKLEKELGNLLQHLNKHDDLQTPLEQRFEADKDLIASSSLIRLKNTKDKNLALKDSKKSLGLAGLQADTRSFFEKAAGAEKIEDADKKQLKKILEKLDEIHKAREEILAQAVSENAQLMANAAFQKLMTRIHLPIEDRSAKGAGTNLDDNTTSEFLEKLKAQNHSRLQNEDQGKEGPYIELLEGKILSSNDPVQLGLGFAAAKWKRVKISSSNPEFALTAARTALDAGVEQIFFSEELEKMFENMHNFNSKKEYYRLSGLYTALKKEMSLKLTKEADKTYNEAFSPEKAPKDVVSKEQEKLDIKLQAWGMIPSSDPNGHAGVLADLNAADQAKLAYSLAGRGASYWIPDPASFYAITKAKVKVDVVEYMHHLITGGAPAKKKFYDALATHTADACLERIKKGGSSEDISKEILNTLDYPSKDAPIRVDTQNKIITGMNDIDDSIISRDQKEEVRGQLAVNYMAVFKNDPDTFKKLSQTLAENVKDKDLFLNTVYRYTTDPAMLKILEKDLQKLEKKVKTGKAPSFVGSKVEKPNVSESLTIEEGEALDKGKSKNDSSLKSSGPT